MVKSRHRRPKLRKGLSVLSELSEVASQAKRRLDNSTTRYYLIILIALMII